LFRQTAVAAALTVFAILAVFVLAPLAAGGIRPNPANDSRLIDRPIEAFRYDEATHCSGKETKGARRLAAWLEDNVRGELWGIYRCEKWGKHSASLHAEGRAIDWHLDARDNKSKRAGYRFIETLLATDGAGNEFALARRMGVQGIIYNCRSWYGWGKRLQKYSYCYKNNGERRRSIDPTQGHIDHIHIELNSSAARLKTSFWRSPLGRG